MRRITRGKRNLAEEQVAFERLWDEIREHEALPDRAILNMAQALSRETKGRLSTLEYEKAVSILNGAIDEANRGSVEAVEQLVRKRL